MLSIKKLEKLTIPIQSSKDIFMSWWTRHYSILRSYSRCFIKHYGILRFPPPTNYVLERIRHYGILRFWNIKRILKLRYRSVSNDVNYIYIYSMQKWYNLKLDLSKNWTKKCFLNVKPEILRKNNFSPQSTLLLKYFILLTAQEYRKLNHIKQGLKKEKEIP